MTTKPNCGICGKQITGDTGLAIFQANTPLMIRNTCSDCTDAIKIFIASIRVFTEFDKKQAKEIIDKLQGQALQHLGMDPNAISETAKEAVLPISFPAQRFQPGGIHSSNKDSEEFIIPENIVVKKKEAIIHNHFSFIPDITNHIERIRDEDL